MTELTVTDGARVVMTAVSVFTLVLYLRLAWNRAMRRRRGLRQGAWPVRGLFAVCLFLLATAATSVGRRGQDLQWWTFVAWFGVLVAWAEVVRNWRFRLRPSWARHTRYRGRKRT